MQVAKEAYEGVFVKHATAAADTGCSWVFTFNVTDDDAKSESLFHHVISNLRGITDVKETISPELLIVTPSEGGSMLHISGVNHMSKYCANESLTLLSPNDRKWVIQSLVESEELPNELSMGVRSDVIKTSDGVPVSSDVWLTIPKHYRIERTFRYAVTPMCTYQAKMIRQATDSFDSMRSCGVTSAVVHYQYEMQWTGSQQNAWILTLLGHVVHMIQILKNISIPITSTRIAEVRQEYADLVNGHIDRSRRSNDVQFMAPKPITLEQRHLVEASATTYGNTSIYQGYCVTDKADGERMLLFVTKSGEAYFINNDLDVRPAAFKASKFKNVLMDGEYVAANKRKDGVHKDLFAAFDVYFVDGKAVYNLPLVSKGGGNTDTRYSHLTNVCAAQEWTYAGQQYHELRSKIHSFAEGDNMRDACKVLLTNSDGLPYEIDGLIFTPAHLSVCAFYPGKPVKFPMSMRWDLALKWKPPNQNTIDFLVKEVFPPIRDSASNITYRRFNLMTGYDADQWEPISVNKGLALRYMNNSTRPSFKENRYIERKFQPISYFEADVGMAMIASQKIESDTIVEFGYNINATHLPVSRRWEALRVREDKTRSYKLTKSISKTANDFKVAMSIWRSIHLPVSMEMLTGNTQVSDSVVPGSLEERLLSVDDVYYSRKISRQHMLSVNMLNFHNNGVKRPLYDYAPKKDSLLELACGMAGDLPRWQDGGFNFVLGIDLVADNICKAGEGAYARMLNTRFTFKQRAPSGMNPSHKNIVFAIGDCALPLSDGSCSNDPESKALLKILFRKQRVDPMYRYVNGLAANKFSMVSCQFAIHYFFQSETKLDSFLDNVVDNMKPGGVFITTFMDGKSVDNLLSDNNGLAEGRHDNGVPIWAIIKRYDTFGSDGAIFGKHVDVFLENTGRLIPEFLVHTDTLIAKLKARGAEVQETQMFSHNFNAIKNNPTTYPLLNDDIRALEKDDIQTNFSFLNRWMVFKKNKT